MLQKLMAFVCFVSKFAFTELKTVIFIQKKQKSISVCGVSILLIPLATWSYVLLLILCAIFGITFGSSFSFTPMITSRLVDMDDFTVAYGLILLVQGIGSLVGPPLAGWIFDITNR